MYELALTSLAVLSCCIGVYAVWGWCRAASLERSLYALERREAALLDMVGELLAASRRSKEAVLETLHHALRSFDCTIDAILVFAPEERDLACVYAAGRQAGHYHGVRLRREDAAWLPSDAAMRGSRVALAPHHRALVPGDRSAIAVPMNGCDGLSAVVYVSSTKPLMNHDTVAAAIQQAASPYRIAQEREADRARATFDALTGLYTPRAFREELRRQVMLAQHRPAAAIALWFIDTDHFKRVNDTLGHAAGDTVLERMAALLREHLIEGIDVPARNGGDEFCAILFDAHKTTAIERAARFRAAVRQAHFGVPQQITASIGVAAYPYDATGAAELLELADAAMYHSKREGRDRVSFAVDHTSFAVFA